MVASEWNSLMRAHRACKTRRDPMHYESFLIDRLMFVRWTANPTVADVEALEREMIDNACRVGTRLIHIVVLSSVAAPLPEVRERLEKFVRAIEASYEFTTLVVEGESIRSMIIRTAVRALLIVTRQASKSKIVGSVGEAIHLVAPTLGHSALELESRLRARGAIRATNV